MCKSIALNYTIKFVVELLAYLVWSVDGGAHLQHLFQSGFIFLKVLYLLLKSVLSTTVEGRSCRRGKGRRGERGRERERERERERGRERGGSVSMGTRASE